MSINQHHHSSVSPFTRQSAKGTFHDRDDNNMIPPQSLQIHNQMHNVNQKRQNNIVLPNEVRNLLAGGIAGMIAKTFVAPIDRIKILYQVTSAPFRLRDVPNVIVEITKQEGLSALWKGNVATMIRVFPYAGIQFMVYNRIKTYFVLNSQQHNQKEDPKDGGVGKGGGLNCKSSRRLDDIHLKTNHNHQNPTNHILKNNSITIKQHAERADVQNHTTNQQRHKKGKEVEEEICKWNMTPMESLIAGSVAGVTSVLLTYPLDLTRAQLAVLKKEKCANVPTKGFSQVLRSNYANGGTRGLFQGISPTLLGMLPYAGVAFTINEQSKRQIYFRKGRDPTLFEKMVCGGLSGLFAQSLTYPFEVTRRRMQTISILTSQSENTAITVLGGRQCAERVVDRLETKICNTDSDSLKTPARQQHHHGNNPILKSKPMSSTTSSVSMVKIMDQVLKEQGMNGFFKGLSMNWMKGPISFAISFTTFDLVKEWIDNQEECS